MILRCLALVVLPLLFVLLFLGGFLFLVTPVTVEPFPPDMNAPDMEAPAATIIILPTTTPLPTDATASRSTPNIPQLTATAIIRQATINAETAQGTQQNPTPNAPQLTATAIIQAVTATAAAR